MRIDDKYTGKGLAADYRIEVKQDSPQEQISRLTRSLAKIPKDLVRRCNILELGFKDMGPSKEYYPNHGYYVSNTLFLNTQLVKDPVVFKDPNGETLDRFDHTLYHELGHGFDHIESDLSEKDEWLALSGWSKEPEAGKVKIIIEDEGEKLEGEWFYDPSSKFVRFYARRNPWDDFADTFAFYVAGLKGFIPSEKLEYFDRILGRYYE